jgi:hypothetical protein
MKKSPTVGSPLVGAGGGDEGQGALRELRIPVVEDEWLLRCHPKYGKRQSTSSRAGLERIRYEHGLLRLEDVRRRPSSVSL